MLNGVRSWFWWVRYVSCRDVAEASAERLSVSLARDNSLHQRSLGGADLVTLTVACQKGDLIEEIHVPRFLSATKQRSEIVKYLAASSQWTRVLQIYQADIDLAIQLFDKEVLGIEVSMAPAQLVMKLTSDPANCRADGSSGEMVSFWPQQHALKRLITHQFWNQKDGLVLARAFPAAMEEKFGHRHTNALQITKIPSLAFKGGTRE